jgi:hypothetical protein
MFHIITPVYRFENLDKLYETIPAFSDITWHLSFSNRRALPDHSFIHVDPRIKIYHINCEDNDLVEKRNQVFREINNGYFYLLDDDTIFLKESYTAYKKYCNKNFVGMIIGRQYRKVFNGIGRPPYNNAEFNNIDTGMAIAHYSVLKYVKWEWSKLFSRDHLFWSKCYEHFGKDKTITIKDYISVYNYLNNTSPLVYTNMYLFNKRFVIKNVYLARLYVFLRQIKYFPKRYNLNKIIE